MPNNNDSEFTNRRHQKMRAGIEATIAAYHKKRTVMYVCYGEPMKEYIINILRVHITYPNKYITVLTIDELNHKRDKNDTIHLD